MRRRVLWGLGLGALVFVGLAVYGKAPAIAQAISAFNILLLPLALGLSCGNYALRFAKWQYYLGALNISVPRGQSLRVFLSGLTLSITPGKVGELLKSFLLRELRAVPLAHSAPIVFAERLTDLIAIVVLCAGGAVAFGFGWRALAVAGGLCAGLIAGASSRRAAEIVARQVGRWPRLEGLEQAAIDASESAICLLRPKRLALATALSVAAWFCECAELYVVLRGLGEGVEFLQAVFTYALATLVGALTLLPGGLVTTEGSMAGLLQQFGAGRAGAAAATLIVRACTLWFAVAIGVVVLGYVARELGREQQGQPSA